MDTSIEQNKEFDLNNVTHLKKSGINPQLLQGLIISIIFACIITSGHAFIFNLRVNPRMVLQPWLLQHGFLQYTNIPDEHAPLLPQILAWLLPIWNGDALLTMRIVHACLIFVTVFGSVLWLYHECGRWAAIATGAYFIAWSNLGGFWAMWYDLALSPLYLFIFFSLIAPAPATWLKFERRVLVVGLVGGLSLLIKQQAILVITAYIIWLIIQCVSGRISKHQFIRLTILNLIGVSLPLIAYLGYFWYKAGTLSDLFYWTIGFNFTSSYSKLGFLLPSASQVQQLLPAFWPLLPLGISLFIPKRVALFPDRNIRLWLLLFLAISAVMQYPRYSSMHWATALPFMAIGSGIVCNDLLCVGERKSGGQVVQRSIYVAVVLLWLSGLVTIYLPFLRERQSRQLIEYDQLPELADQLRSRNLSGESIVLFPDNEAVSNLYYLLGTPPPKFWLMTYPWFVNEFTLARWMDALESEKPQTAILFEGQFDWTSNQEALAYLQAHYQTVDTLEWEGFPVQIMSRRNTDSP